MSTTPSEDELKKGFSIQLQKLTAATDMTDTQFITLLDAIEAHTQAATERAVKEAEIKAYDAGWEACEKREPVELQDMIEFRQEQYGWKDKEMAAMLDMSAPHFSEFMHRKRGLPIDAIRKAYAIGIPASVLLAERVKQQLTELDKQKGDAA